MSPWLGGPEATIYTLLAETTAMLPGAQFASDNVGRAKIRFLSDSQSLPLCQHSLHTTGHM